MLEHTLTEDKRVRANPQYPVLAGVDKAKVPQLLKVRPDGVIDLGGVTLPKWDAFRIDYFGSTNNVEAAVYTLDGNEVARWTFAYRLEAVSNDDEVISGVFSLP